MENGIKKEDKTKEEPFYFLNIFKDKGMTSFDVIYKLRKRLHIKKIGHSGTLDPMAQGVMQVAVGRASRLLEYLDSDKEYIAKIKFGYKSTTLDLEGEIEKVNDPHFTKEELILALNKFTGKIEQTPPKFSAIKLNGKKLCDIARKTPEKEIPVPKRTVKVYKIELLEFLNNAAKIKFNVSKGTYIRTLGDDIAKALGTRGYLEELIRTKAGNFEIKNSIKIKDVDPNIHKINPIDALGLEKYSLDEDEYEKVKNGVKIKVKNQDLKNETYALIFNGKLVSISEISNGIINIKKNF